MKTNRLPDLELWNVPHSTVINYGILYLPLCCFTEALIKPEITLPFNINHTFMEKIFDKKAAIVTGGSFGIGRAS